MFLLDSSIVIAYFRASEPKHAQVKDWVNSMDGFTVSEHVLSEVATVLQIKETKEIANQALEFLSFNHAVLCLRLTQEELEMTIDLFLKQNEGISFIDASLLILAKERDLSLATLDKALAKSAKIRFPKH